MKQAVLSVEFSTGKAAFFDDMFQYVFSFVGILFAGDIIEEGNNPGDILSDQRAVEEAKVFNVWLKTPG
ncbi:MULTISPECIES: hypothetical protein [Bacillales]|uniref:hypothetical protein n=1 Tax=Bacillales TaxID=1385 RepID=UPI00034C2836|nr:MULTISPECIES: hypothetical protein [Bacillales]KMZ42593.1 hypothetical protein AC624_16560 [Bacillus sp. FJAT-27238]